MKAFFVAQVDELSEFQRAVRRQFESSGSFQDFLVLWGSILAFVIGCRVLWRFQQRITGGAAPSNPKKLFATTLQRLGLGAAEKRLLHTIARAANLSHPTSLLLSPALFDRAVAAWRERGGTSFSGRRRQDPILATLRENLFPE